MAPKRTRSTQCQRAPEKVLRFLDDESDTEEEVTTPRIRGQPRMLPDVSSSEEEQEDEQEEAAQGEQEGTTQEEPVEPAQEPEEAVQEETKPASLHVETEASPPPLQGKTIAIVDVGASTKDYLAEAGAAGGPHHLADEVWAIDEMAGLISHDRAFSMKPLASRTSWYWLCDHPGPLLCSDASPRFPGCVPYPLEDAINAVGVAYLTSSIAYAFSYAMLHKVGRIKIYGVDALEVRPCMEFLVCKALHQGITVQISGTSALLDSNLKAQAKLYGFCDQSDAPTPRRSHNGKLTVAPA